jgi:diguanylate cyclase (GGDEF)-like protein
LKSYRACLAATAAFGVQACPPIGGDFQQSLLNLQDRVSVDTTPDALAATEAEAEHQLRQWGERSAEYLKEKAAEVKDLMMVLAQAAEQLVDHDKRYSTQFEGFSTHLRAIADLEDLHKIRESLVESAAQLKVCAYRMTEDSQKSVAKLRAEVSTYQARLEESERLALRDYLTGLGNRRKVEQEIESRIQQGRAFTLLLLDLNKFKPINDQLGHAAGDEVLKQFATELKTIFRASDVVGRWGGDEFLVVLDCALNQAKAQMARIREWVFGDYTVKTGEGSRKVQVAAAMGVAVWKPGETMESLLKRVDEAMYQDKRR